MAEEVPFAGFEAIVRSHEDLAGIVGTPPQKVLDKVIHRLDDLCRDFIARAPFCVVATAHPDGHLDLSPKGDPAGFATVLGDTLLALPDRPGNRRLDTFHNVLADPRVGLMFLIPGKGETLRVRGEARIVRDRALCERMAVEGKVPTLALVVHVKDVFFHCPKAMIRSHLWEPAEWGDSSAVADIGTAMIAHTHSKLTPEELFAEAEREGMTALY